MDSQVVNRTLTVALVGNPNSGKTTLSNSLTGAKDGVANYPRVTVSKRTREVQHTGWTIKLVDLPGIYSLTSQSPEERIGRDFIQDGKPDILLNVLDAGNLDRSLFLTTQLIEMGVPRIFALNMSDEMSEKGYVVDIPSMATMLDGPIVETVATTGVGLPALLDLLVNFAENRTADNSLKIPYDSHLQASIGRVQEIVSELHLGESEALQSRWISIKLLEGDDEMLRREEDHELLIERLRRERFDLEHTHHDTVEMMFADARYGFIHGLLSEVRQTVESPETRLNKTRSLDKVLLHRTLGMPLFLFLMWLMFEATFTLGNYPMDWIDGSVGWFSGIVASILPDGMVRGLVVDGIIAGVGGTIIFLPNIVILFFFLAFFSESGYLSRSAFQGKILNR